MSKTPRRVGRRELLFLATMFAAATLLLAHTDWLWRWDHLFYDATLSIWESPPPENIVIVAIDEQSLSALGRWPWPRRTHAELVRRLGAAGAKVVALDIIFSESDSRDPAGDQALAEAIGENDRVVLPVLLEQPRTYGQLFEQMPLPPLAEAAAALGHIHVELDADGLARSVFLLEGLGESRWPALPLAMLRVAQPDGWSELPGTRAPRPRLESYVTWARDHQILIPFVGPPGRVPRISYVQALRGDHPEGVFESKFVLVGVTATGLGDNLPTPVSGHNQPMSGVELSANVLYALSAGKTITRLELPARALMLVMISVLPFLLYPRLGPRYALLSGVGLFVSTLGLSITLVATARVWLAPAPAMLAVLLSYPVWSWLRLESAMRHLRLEASRIQREQTELRVARLPDFAPATRFLSELMPLRGWLLLDAAGTTRDRWGQAPASEPPSLAMGEWKQIGSELWGALHAFGQDWCIGATWSGSEPPSAQEKNLLTEVLERYGRTSRRAPTDHLEVVQAQILELEVARDRLEALRQMIDDGLAQMADGVLVVNALGQVLLANRQAGLYLLGDGNKDLIDQPVLGLLVQLIPEDSTDWRREIRRTLIHRLGSRVNARHENGRDLLLQLAPLAGRPERLGGIIINISDISDLRQRERERAEVLSFLSHDLRSPLVSVLALVELARHGQSRDESLASLEQVEIQTRKTLELAEQFVELVRAETQAEVRLEELDIVEVATNAIELVWAQARSRKITLERRSEFEVAWTRGDSSLLERALVNLLNNAVNYSPGGTKVELVLESKGKELYASVIDQGPGIAPEELPELFDRFKRGAAGGSSGTRGIGLGLAFVKAVAERHSGRVEATSEPGKGSRFTLVLPLDA
jgi:CHASE2 domain-containing sensor protein/signal transduction histidine kinase